MPAAYAHQSMALEVLNILDEDIKVIINRHLLNYLVGALGPDPLYYYNPLKGLPLYKKADLVHAMSMKEIFNLNKSPSEGYLAYILGLICHFTLDTKTHEYIYQIEKQGYSPRLLPQDGRFPLGNRLPYPTERRNDSHRRDCSRRN